MQEWWDDDPITLAAEDEPGMDQYIVAVDAAALRVPAVLSAKRIPARMAWARTRRARAASTSSLARRTWWGEATARPSFARSWTACCGVGVPRVITDPDPANARAIRAYGKAGFSRHREVDTPDGRALLMIRDKAHSLE